MTNNDRTDRTAHLMASADRAASYGAQETNPLWMSEATHEDITEWNVALGDPRVKRVVRLRLLTEPGYPYYDISYCYAQLKTGEYVRLQSPMHLRRSKIKGDLIAWAREEKVNAKALGLLDEGNWSILR